MAAPVATHVRPDPTVRLLAALADPVRLDIVRQLSMGEDVCACDFDVHPRVAQPTVSHHLRVLRDAGVVRSEREGTFVHYSLDPSAFEPLATLVRSLLPPALEVMRVAPGRRLPVVEKPADAPVTSGR